MKKEEFLEGLRNALMGEVSPAVIQENLQYYKEYIQSETSKGQDESVVLEELGDPRLIAHTIIDTTPGAGAGAYEEYTEGDSRRSAGEQTERQGTGRQGNKGVHYYDLSKWYWKLLGIAAVVLVVILIVTVVGGILSLVIPMLPVLGLIMVVMWFVRGGPRH